MILYFADRHLNILGQANTQLPDGVRIVEDLKTEDIETGISIFEARIAFDRKTRSKVEEWTEAGNYVLRSTENENEFYTIIDVEINTKKQTVYIYTEDDGLDLINEVAGAYEADQPYPIADYINRFASGSGWVIGVNEVSGLVRQLSWDSDQTTSARLLNIAEAFNNCDISYSYKIDGLKIVKKYINIYEERGKDTGIQLRLNKEIDSIVTSKSVANLATALKATGGTPDDSEDPITLLGYEYDDGDYFVDGYVLKSRKAFSRWSRYLWKGDTSQQQGGHIVKSFSYDTTSQALLCEKAIEELKSISDMEVNYDVDISKFPESVKIGDRVNIIDDQGDLYLTSRILILETSITDKKRRAVLGDHIIRKSGIASKVEKLAAQFAKSALSVSNAMVIANAAKNTADEAKTSAENAQQAAKKEIEEAIQSAMEDFDASAEHIYVKYSPYEGGRDADGNIVWTDSVQDNTVFLGTCATNEKTAPDTPESYQWVRVRGIDGRGISKVENYYLTTDKSENVTLDDFSGIKPDVIVSPTKGKPYIWNYEKILYSDGSSDSSAPSLIGHYGVDGTGIEKIEELYAVSTSGTTAPITGWGTSVPSMTATNRFLWNKETIYFTDGTSQPTDPMVIGVYGEKGDKGDTGKGISSVKNYYLISSSSSGITTASTGWVETPIPTPTSAKPYLWNYEKIIYTNGDTLSTTPCVIGNFAKDGANGASINTITEYYALTATNTAPSINQFKTAVQTPTSALPYLWNYEVITYTGGKTATSTAIRLMGVYGQKGDTGDTGRGVASIKTQYYRSTSRTTQTGGTWSDSYPEWQAGTYLWTREVTTFTNPAGTSNGSPVLDTSWDALSDLKESISVTDEASKELNETLANALGLHVTEKTVNNATVRYYHSNPTLTSSTNGDTILVFNSSGFGVCTTGWNGGNPVFTYGTTFDGKAVWNILSANKISADLIEAGVIKSLSDAAVQSKWNLNDGTMEFTSGDDNLLIKGRTKDSGETVEETAKLDAVNPYRFLGIHMSNSAGEIVSVTPGFIGFLSDEYMAQLSLYVQALIKDALNGTNTADKYIPTNIYSSRITKDGIITKFIKCQDILFPGDGEEVRLMDVLERISALEDKVFVKYNLYVGVAYSSSGRGETTPSGINSYRSGESITIDAIPSPGYVFSCWGYSGDGTTNYTKQSNTNGKPLYTFTKNEKEDRYVAYFDYPSTYTIDTTVGSTLYIGNGSTEIASNAYYNNSDISTVIIPNSITAIGLNAFSGCSGITSVTLGSGITDIRGYAFMGCNNLKYIYLPASVTNIYYHAFDGCSSLNTVYFGGTEAQWNAIYNAGYNDSLFNAPNIIFNYSI